jgi:hypothetical protein
MLLLLLLLMMMIIITVKYGYKQFGSSSYVST